MKFAVFTLLSLALLVLDHRQKQLDEVRAALSALIYPIHYAINLPSKAGGWLSDNLALRTTLVKNNARLRQLTLELQLQAQKAVGLEAENLRLRGLRAAAGQASQRILIAELMAIDLDPFGRKVLLSKGESDGIYVGQPILDTGGVMGQVIKVGPLSATAMLITDASHGLPVMVVRSGLRAIANGTGESDRLTLAHVPKAADIKLGDLLVTSGLDGRFPPNYPVGRVKSVVLDPAVPFARITVTPSARLDHNREVLLIWPGTQLLRPPCINDECTPSANLIKRLPSPAPLPSAPAPLSDSAATVNSLPGAPAPLRKPPEAAPPMAVTPPVPARTAPPPAVAAPPPVEVKPPPAPPVESVAPATPAPLSPTEVPPPLPPPPAPPSPAEPPPAAPPAASPVAPKSKEKPPSPPRQPLSSWPWPFQAD